MKTSIIMTSFNYEKFIPQAIESVINQTVPDWELIIIDDGSTDNSLNVIEHYTQKDSRIKLFTHENGENKGLCASVRLGIEKAENDWVAFLESDDFWAENYLEEKTKFIDNHPEIVLLYNDIECFGDEKKIIKTKPYFERLQKLWENKVTQDVFDCFGTENIVPTFSCVMCKKDILLSCNFAPKCKPLLDYWLWWQMAEKGNFGFINKKLTHWQFHSKSYITRYFKTVRYHYEHLSFFRDITKLFKKQPKLRTLYFLEKNLILSFFIHILFYIKRNFLMELKLLINSRFNAK